MISKQSPLDARLTREQEHARELLRTDEKNWGWNTPAGRIRFQRRLDFLKNAANNPEAVVLEIGTGTGTYSGGLLEKFPKLISVDISQLLLDRAKERFPHGTFRVMDAHDLDLDEESVDAVVGCSILHHLDWHKALRSAYKVLKPGGVLRFSEPNLLNPQIFIQKSVPWVKKRAGDSPDEYAFTPAQIVRALSQAGFTDIKAEPFEFLHPATPEALIPTMIGFESLLSKTSLKSVGGSILIEARKAVKS